MYPIKRTLLTIALVTATLSPEQLPALGVSSASATHHTYKVVVLPPDGGSDSFLAGYLFYAPLTEAGTVGLLGDAGNSFTWTDGREVSLRPLPQLPPLTGTSTLINWINQWGVSAGFGTRIDSTTGASFDHAAIWFANGRIFPLSAPPGSQSRAVWINDFGQASGWIAPGSMVDGCSFGVGLQAHAVVWEFGIPRPLGTLGGTNSYGEFINDRGQISGHSQTSDVPNPNTGCPPFDPFVWENGKMTDINPGNFGGSMGGTNFLSNGGQAVGFGTLPGELGANAFLWSQGKLTNLTASVGTLGGGGESALNVNDQGHVVGAGPTPERKFLAVLWRNGEFIKLMSLSAEGDDCSEPFRINSQDQIVGVSFSCKTGVSHAFIWENGSMADLNTLIPSDSGIELQSANWINDDGVIAAQGVLTTGDNSGATRAVLLIPAEDDGQVASAASPTRAAVALRPGNASAGVGNRISIARTKDGRVNPIILRPFDPSKLLSTPHD